MKKRLTQMVTMISTGSTKKAISGGVVSPQDKRPDDQEEDQAHQAGSHWGKHPGDYNGDYAA